ncbi:thiol-activated cytolysin family protein [Seonamhaeicola aphaedonensis]|uniref:Thiol-activated cytolysin n=1 Tax=Seonamhaeicola aphaedonensis TaxID=1461338 RepID=A0A3D9HIU5_9FLAO|nr:thiol-activated cytolysin family protein [Seonamhaeicola aphaedonensis]RED49417.1 thiol-activated cytolysin [Seonamhaeicola aphaedonensis]
MKTQLLTIKPSKLGVILCLMLFTFLSCSTESTDDRGGEAPVSGDKLLEINNFLASLSDFSQPEVSGEQLLEESEPEREGQTDECVVKKYKMAPGFSEMILLDPTSDVIYPGAMLRGESIPTGEYIGITGGRAPITLSVSLENLNGKPSTVINNPNINTVREGVKDMLQQGVTGSASAKVNFTTEEVYSEEHLNIALGASYTKGKNSVSGSFNFNSSEKKYKYVVKYLQVNYTIDLAIEDSENPGKLFTQEPNLDGTSPVIVSSVKYGRMLLYTVETNAGFTDTQAAFNAAFSGGEVDGQGEHQSFWNSSTVKALVIGGNSSDAAQVVSGPEGVYNYITQGGEYSANSPGAPLGYTLRYIRKGFPIANVVLSSEYNIRTCYQAYQKFGIQLYGLNLYDNKEFNDNLSLRGTMKAAIYQDGVKKASVSYTRTSNDYIKPNEGQFWAIPSGDEIREVELYMLDLQNDYVFLSAEFWEDDVIGSNDYLGKTERTIFLKDVQNGKDKDGDGDDDYVRLLLTEDPDVDMRTYFYVWRVY